MSKRNRWNDQELLEPFAALLRQSTSRVVERLRLVWTRNTTLNLNNTMPITINEQRTHIASNLSINKYTQLLPFDRLVIEYTLYYLDHSLIPEDHYIRMAQDVLAGSVERIRFAPLFSKSSSLPVLCEMLVEENSASSIESAMTEIEAWTDVRAVLGEWIANRCVHESSADRLIKDEMDNYDDNDDDDDDDNDYYNRRSSSEEEEEQHNTTKVNMRNANREDWLEENKNYAVSDALLDLVAIIYKSLEFWVRVQSFINALSEGFAKMNVVELEPRYERELVLLLHRLSRNNEYAQSTIENGKHEITNTTVSTSPLLPDKEKEINNECKEEFDNSIEIKMKTESIKVKLEQNESEEHQLELLEKKQQQEQEYYEQEEKEEENEENEKKEEIVHKGSNSEDGSNKQQLANVVLGDTLALSHCYVPAMDHSVLLRSSTPSIVTSSTLPAKATLLIDIPDKLKQELRGINYNYYTMVHARLGMMITREQLRLFGLHNVCSPPRLNSQQNELLESAQMQAMQHGNMFAMFGSNNMNVNGLPVDYVPDENYYTRLLASQQDAINEDENIYSDEVIDYYLRKKNTMSTNNHNNAAQNNTVNSGQVYNKQQQQQRNVGMRGSNVTVYRDINNNNNKLVTTELIKPHRFCKVKTGYTWNQYNRTHYDSRTNPPPRTVLWYEFTLFYPALVNTKKGMRHIFHIEETPRGAEDDYCLLVFSVGPPYADVAYRIVKKQWDTRKGGVRISFDATGRYKLFFRFTNSNYRR